MTGMNETEMNDRTPKAGEIYRHFKNKLYQVVGIAAHSETGEKLVVYQALYGSYGLYVRPLEMFVSPVDHEKYPQVTQQWRFEKVNPETAQTPDASGETVQVTQDLHETAEKNVPQPETSTAEEELAGADPRLIAFLEADTYEQKYKVLKSMENDITDRLINDFAVVLDVVIPEGDLNDRYTQLKHCVATMCRYETTRFR